MNNESDHLTDEESAQQPREIFLDRLYDPVNCPFIKRYFNDFSSDLCHSFPYSKFDHFSIHFYAFMGNLKVQQNAFV